MPVFRRAYLAPNHLLPGHQSGDRVGEEHTFDVSWLGTGIVQRISNGLLGHGADRCIGILPEPRHRNACYRDSIHHRVPFDLALLMFLVTASSEGPAIAWLSRTCPRGPRRREPLIPSILLRRPRSR